MFVGGISGNKKLNEVFALPKPHEKLQNYNLKTEWVKLPNITSDHLNLHSYSVCENENNIYITGGHCSHQNTGSTSDLVSAYRAGAHDWITLPKMLSARGNSSYSSFIQAFCNLRTAWKRVCRRKSLRCRRSYGRKTKEAPIGALQR